jgi:hypothetical protein
METRADEVTRARLLAIGAIGHLDSLWAASRYGEAPRLGESVWFALRDLSPAQVAGVQEDASEQELAATLAEILNDGECWQVFQHPERTPPQMAADRAVGLIRSRIRGRLLPLIRSRLLISLRDSFER